MGGLAVGLASGVLKTGLDGDSSSWFGAGYSALGGLALWTGTQAYNRRLRWFRRWIENLFLFDLAPAAMNILFAALGAVIWYAGWLGLVQQPFDAVAAQVIALMSAVQAALFGYVYRLPAVIVARRRSHRRVSMLMRATADAQMAALKAQLDPHFLQNNINTLCYLIDARPERAGEFADDLLQIHGYALEQGSADFVDLKDELAFVDHYMKLLQCRFDGAISLKIDRLDAQANALIPPFALQTLVENAVKHNRFSRAAPLCVQIEIGDSRAKVINPYRPAAGFRGGDGQGLANLDGRLRLLAGEGIEIDRLEGFFAVSVPLLRNVQ